MSFNEMLKKLRTNKELTQEELAQATGLSRSAIGMYEAGSREPSFETLEIFADFFNVDMNTLLDKNQWNPTYCLDPETAKLIRELYDNPNLRSLMDASRKLAPDDVKNIADIVAKMKKKENNEND